MKFNKNNIYIKSHNRLIQFCEQCTSSNKIACSKKIIKCSGYLSYLRDIYFNELHPYHPCKNCLTLAICKHGDCEKYWHYYRIRLIAECELIDDVVFFSKEKIQIVVGPKNLINKEYIETVPHFRNQVDFETTERYIQQIKKEPNYNEIVDNVRQRLIYNQYIEDEVEQPDFRTDFS